MDMYFQLLKKSILVSCMIALSACSLAHFPAPRSKTEVGNAYAAARLPALLNEADDFYRAGNLPAAEDKYLAVIELDAKQPRALYRLGNITFKQAQYEKARDYFSRTVDADPGNSKAHYNLAVTHITLAQEDFKAYIAGEPNNAHRPQIETLMHHIDEFGQDKPSDATLPSPAVQSSNSASGEMLNKPADKSSATPAQAVMKTPSIVRRPVKKPKRPMIMKRAIAPGLSQQENPQVKTMPMAQKKSQLMPAADPLDALANQLKNP